MIGAQLLYIKFQLKKSLLQDEKYEQVKEKNEQVTQSKGGNNSTAGPLVCTPTAHTYASLTIHLCEQLDCR